MILFFTLKAITNPIQQLSIDMLKLTNLKKNTGKEDMLSVFSDIREMQIHIKSMKRDLTTFSKYVPEVVVEKVLIQQDYSYGEAGLKTQNMSVLFCELNICELANEMDSSALLDLINDYFELVCRATHNYGGLVDKFNTNALVCYFNEETFPVYNHEQNACSLALEIVNQIEKELCEKHITNRILCKPSMKVSINSGEMTCGLLGSDTRMNFSMIGRNYDLATHMLHLNNHYKTKILISSNTLRKIKDQFICYFVDELEEEQFSPFSSNSVQNTRKEEIQASNNDTFVIERPSVQSSDEECMKIYELICHVDEASELHKKIQSDLFQIETFFKNEQYHYMYDKCSNVLVLEDLYSVECLRLKSKARLNGS